LSRAGEDLAEEKGRKRNDLSQSSGREERARPAAIPQKEKASAAWQLVTRDGKKKKRAMPGKARPKRGGGDR